MEHAFRELRFAARQLLHRPAYTVLAVATLALGIGATVAVFSVLHSVVMRPLPYPDPERLVRLHAVNEREGAFDEGLAGPDVIDLQATLTGFELIGAALPHGLSFSDDERPREHSTYQVTPGLLAELSAPVVGRTFHPEEAVPGNQRVVVLTHALWQQRFGGDRGVVGRQVRLDGEEWEVVGVMPADFDFLEADVELWVPHAPDPARLSRHARWWPTIGRLRPGVTLSAAQAEVDAATARLAEAYPASNAGWGVRLEPLHEDVVGGVRPALVVLLAAAGLVLLIACANSANLVLARTLGRRREVAVRTALGAKRGHLTRLVLAEALLLAAAGAVLGVVLAYWGVELLVHLGPPDLPRLTAIEVDRTALGFAAAAALVTALVVGTLPALHLARRDPQRSLGEGRGLSGGGRQPLRRALTVVQVALSLALLLGAGLMLRSFSRVLDSDPGFDAARIAGVQLFAYGDSYRAPGSRQAFFDRLLDEVGALPGVEAAGAVNALPITQLGEGDSGVEIHGRPDAEATQAGYRVITPGYLDTMGIALRDGRGILPSDRADSEPVALINQVAARSYFPGEDPLGERLRTRGAVWFRIVGVVEDVRHDSLEAAPRPEVFFPFAQRPTGAMTVVARVAGDPALHVSSLESRVWEVNPAQPVYRSFTMPELRAQTTGSRRFYTTLIALFSALAVFVAAIGLYAVVSYAARLRTRELAMRMALGADRGNVLGLVLRQGSGMVAAGIALGLAGGLALARLADSMLWGVEASDPTTLVAATLLLTAVALAACWLPAHRAARLDPIEALRLG
ncbi:MAG TPA: ABC transporter permease [Thermoanaerobaculia bacterium]|nr:ABC transporter permease [Thermoanaerobaculia bacterium]